MSIEAGSLSSEAQYLFNEALKLPEGERAKLAEKLSSILVPMADPAWQAAWGSEIERRIAEAENGTAELSDWNDARRRLWERLGVQYAEAGITIPVVSKDRLRGIRV